MTESVIRALKGIDPVVYVDGTEVYRRFMEEYLVHRKGLFIVAPSGSGKTYFVNRQTAMHWIDGDDLWIAAGAHPDRDWWNDDIEVVLAIDQRSDIITEQARRLGLWIIGASNYWLLPDAIVLPDWDTHQRYIVERERGYYDGGARQEDLSKVLDHRRWLTKLSNDEGIPIFTSVQEAASSLESEIGT
ncbi:MAG: hypothetical protein JOZ41_21235 [Chloroflexi bacterium]|nr:hypothetical protein [Chloroflexota bacterium]